MQKVLKLRPVCFSLKCFVCFGVTENPSQWKMFYVVNEKSHQNGRKWFKKWTLNLEHRW